MASCLFGKGGAEIQSRFEEAPEREELGEIESRKTLVIGIYERLESRDTLNNYFSPLTQAQL